MRYGGNSRVGVGPGILFWQAQDGGWRVGRIPGGRKKSARKVFLRYSPIYFSNKGKKLEEISIFSATFCLAQQKQVNIWLKRILDTSTTHFDQVLPNKIFLTS